jgi:hypothetical protein
MIYILQTEKSSTVQLGSQFSHSIKPIFAADNNIPTAVGSQLVIIWKRRDYIQHQLADTFDICM